MLTGSSPGVLKTNTMYILIEYTKVGGPITMLKKTRMNL